MTILLNRPRRLTLLADYKHIYKAYFGTFNSKVNDKHFQHQIFDRTMDKTHRLFYRSLDREKYLYKKRHIVIEPSIKHLLVKFQKEAEGRLDEMKLSDRVIPNPFKMQNLLEPIIFHGILSLSYILDDRGLDSKYLRSQYDAQIEHLTAILNKINSSKNGKLSYDQIKNEAEEQVGSSIESIATKVISKFKNDENHPDNINDYFFRPLQMALICFIVVSKKAYNQMYTIEDDLVPWILSVMSSSVSGSCESLRNLSRIPPCITSDILLRTPMSKNEYYLQTDIWIDFMKEIGAAYHNRIKHIKLCINNLIFYGIQYDSHKLPDLICKSLQFFTSTKSGYTFHLIDQDFLNSLIWKVIFDYLRSSIAFKPHVITSIIKVQEILVQGLSKVGDERKKVHSKLDTEGNMGIVLAINHVSQEKAEKLFKMAEDKLMVSDEHISNTKLMVSYHFTKIFLSITPEQLLHNFNDAASDYVQSATLWLGFIKKLNEFGLLNEKRSKKILIELVNNKEKVLITKDIVLLLLQPIQTLADIDEFIAILQGKSSTAKDEDCLLAVAHSSSILPKYLTILYKNVHINRPQTNQSPWNDQKAQFISPFYASKQISLNPKTFASVLSFARNLYETGFKKKTSKIVGIMLAGEANIQPENIYDLYNRELFEKNNLLPDDSCLAALIKAAMKQVNGKGNDSTTCIMWGDLYAPQVAIHEFKKYVMAKSSDGGIGKYNVDPGVYPLDDLWQKYIHLLAKYDYISELSIIIQWWEYLNFKPSYATLLILLGSLPIEYGSRYIKHFEKVKADSSKSINTHRGEETNTKNNLDWSWPTINQLETFKARKA